MKSLSAVPLVLLLLLPACGGEGESTVQIDEDAAWGTLDIGMERSEFEGSLALLDGVKIDPPPRVGEDYEPVFPDPIPFDPAEWKTNDPAPTVAETHAVPGGTLRLGTRALPSTLRTEGPNSRSSVLSTIHYMIYEQLLGFDPTTKRYVPGLATHWQVSEDQKTFRFRIDPDARWSDGREVTADDVLASIEHLQNPDRKDPGVARRWNEMIESATILDKYTVEVRAKEARWRTFLSLAAGMYVLPAAYIRMDGETYISDWNWKLPPGTGPYEIRPEGLKKGRSLTIHRRKNWWARNKPGNEGAYNFDKISWLIVRDAELEYTKFLAGELDAIIVTRAQRWEQELEDVDQIRKGWVQRRRIFNKEPQGYGGFCLNMRRRPFDNRDIRLAFAHLYNREKLMSSFFFHQYEYTDSYFPGMDFARPNAKRIRYDPDTARALLAKAGWVKKDDEGWLVNEKGERFPEIRFEFGSSASQRIHDVYKNDLWNEAGIKMTMKIVNSATLSKKMWEYKFQMFYINWTASNFPALDLSWSSRNADELQTNNLPGFKDPKVDAIIEKYKVEFDGQKRTEMLQRLDEIFFEAHPYVLAWYGPNFRLLYWDKFGHPPEYAGKYNADIRNLLYYWWYDEAKDKRTLENRKRGASNYPDVPTGRPPGQYGEIDQKYWRKNKFPLKD